jgi:hypothetical protein
VRTGGGATSTRASSDDRTGEQRVVRVHGPGRFLGELSLPTGQTEFYTAIALQAGEVLVVPVDRTRALVSQDPLRQLGVGPEDTPVIVWRDRVLRNPSNAELARVVGLAAAPDSESTCWSSAPARRGRRRPSTAGTTRR